jgi:phosphatidylserine/phosphatidylglycerophosphate/cardiolipin synthase-like enzyme
LKNAGIPVGIDQTPGLAHNKLMIFDDRAVFTGSFNFSRRAQEANCENGIVIRGDRALIKAYEDNWRIRLGRSSAYNWK